MSASPASFPQGAYPSASALRPGQTLRGLLEARRAQGQVLSLEEAIAIAVPLALDLKQRHDRGERWFVHPSCIIGGHDGLARVEAQLAGVPDDPRDRACLAPEQQTSPQPGDARASVFSIGAILYEAVVGHSVGPAMRRPASVIANIPDAFEILLAKALVGDPAHRPGDLGALASAMHHLAPMRSLHPPDADESRLDHADGFDVDIRLSMLPPSEIASMPPADIAPPPAHAAGGDPTTRLAMLKQQLESDPRPRYVVSKDRMDHGPFSAVELLQQIASNTFIHSHILRDEISGQEHAIGEWPEFAPFAEQAGLKREIVAEKHAVVQAELKEKSAGAAKIIISVSAVLAVAIVVGIFLYQKVGSRKDDVVLSDDPNAVGYDLQGGVKGQKRPPAPGSAGGGGGGGGGHSGGGMSYEAALANNVQEVAIGSGKGEPDLSDAQLTGPLKNAKFVSGCGAPSDMTIAVKVAIKNGRAVGVSVYPNPPNPGVASCIDHAIRGLSWPSNSKMDSLTTTY